MTFSDVYGRFRALSVVLQHFVTMSFSRNLIDPQSTWCIRYDCCSSAHRCVKLWEVDHVGLTQHAGEEDVGEVVDGRLPGSGDAGVCRQPIDAFNRRHVDMSTHWCVNASMRQRVYESTRRRIDAWTCRRVDVSTRQRDDMSTR